jgi:hypothetical protein
MNTITANILPARPTLADRCVNTGRVRIGIAHQPRQRLQPTRDMEALQRALLDPRTARPAGLTARLIGGVWSWL